MFWNELHLFDQGVSLEINSWGSPLTDSLWLFFSSIPVWIPMYILIVAFLIWKLGWKRGLIVVAAAGLTFGFCDQFSNLIKDAVERVRPLNDAFMIENGLNILEGGSRSYSFFSAHAANAFGLATCTFVALRNLATSAKWIKLYAAWMFTWAPLVAISRVFVGKHYLGDVLTGAVVGVIAGYFFARLAISIIKRLSARKIHKS